ncbi:MAG: hypothetical protein K6B28_08645 [Lachnospiraceae bacterium]|jgi:hypothetical protein|nr:hypothetical protein [Lachnospiraceae bacterium]
MKRWNELARSSIEQAGCIIVLLVFVIISVASGNRERNTNAAISGDINEGWIDEDGQAVDLYDLEPGDHSVTLDIRGLDTEGKAICFKTVDTNFRVYASDLLNILSQNYSHAKSSAIQQFAFLNISYIN